MKVNVVVNCQYFENYNVESDGFNTFGDKQPHWKPKGGHTFTITIDSDTVTYTEPSELVSICSLVEKQNNVAARFQYMGHEVQWSGLKKLRVYKRRLKNLFSFRKKYEIVWNFKNNFVYLYK